MIDDLPQLERTVAELQRNKDQARGALAVLKKRMAEEFGCKTLKQAKQKLEALKRKELRAAEAYTAAKIEFEKKWRDKL